ncbi:MAG: zinc ribbon domain-containing protein [Candidatus Aminicenantes bacterium]|nr:zinc ribbon domain-containing protein [Candidatus Aminicenantes bacterium]
MDTQFKDIEQAFNDLKKKFQAGEISRQEFVEEMKKLRLKDGQGRFWMIGAQSGKWYYFEGKDWVQSEPPSLAEKKAICIYCGFENKLEAEICARCGGNLIEGPKVCPKCGTKLEEPFLTCPNCSSQLEASEPERAARAKPEEKAEESGTRSILRAVHPVSTLLFGGTFGLFLGIILGAFAGATAAFTQSLAFFPAALLELQGKLLGALIYAVLGGFGGFLVVGAFSFLVALISNFILSLVGGIRFTVGKRAEKEKKKKPEDSHDYGFNFGPKE